MLSVFIVKFREKEELKYSSFIKILEFGCFQFQHRYRLTGINIGLDTSLKGFPTFSVIQHDKIYMEWSIGKTIHIHQKELMVSSNRRFMWHSITRHNCKFEKNLGLNRKTLHRIYFRREYVQHKFLWGIFLKALFLQK